MDSRPQAGKSEPEVEPIPSPGEPAYRRILSPGSPGIPSGRWANLKM